MGNEHWQAPRRSSPIAATISIPGSKSATNRALILAALADEPSILRKPLHSRDTQLMAAGLRALGVRIEESDQAWTLTAKELTGPAQIDVGNAGTVMRFLPGVAALATGSISFDGDPRSHERPIAPIIDGLRQLGAQIDDGDRGRLPMTIHGTGSLRGGTVNIDASSSSQFVSALLLVGAATVEGITVHHTGEVLPSQPHIEMTIEMLANVGVQVTNVDNHTWTVAPQKISVLDTTIEPDLSNAAPFLAAAMVTNGEVVIRDWPRQTTQAGDHLRSIMGEMGARFEFVTDGLKISGGQIHGINRSLHEVGELTPVIAALCALADSPSQLSGIAHLRLHETDRLQALADEINGLGGDVTVTNDGLIINPQPLTAGTFHTYDDHRLATAGAVLGLAVDGVEVENIATTAKTMPDFPGLWSEMLRG